jgi:ABC-type sugar transport system ATPase subunit
VARVVLDHVYKRFDQTLVVEDACIDVPDRSFTVLVGPSGCGKSTTLRMIAGLEEVSEGTLRIADRDVRGVAPKDRDIAMVFQSYALYPHMTVRENMAFGLTLRRMPSSEIATRVSEAAAMLELDGLLDRYPRQLSGGQRQRVAMGRAIVRRPAVFLFDEPLSNLDARLRGSMRADLARLHARLGATSVYVTHDQLEAMTLADQIVVMKSGRVQQAGRPLEVYERPANTFVAEFMGAPTMNLFDAELSLAEGSACLRADGVALDLPARDGLRPGPVRVGIRPQDLVRDAGGTLVLEVEVVELLGSEALVHGRAGGIALVARTPVSEEVHPGQRVELTIDPARVHVFDRSTGLRIQAT